MIIEIHVPGNAPGRSIAIVNLGCLPDVAMLWRNEIPASRRSRVANWALLILHPITYHDTRAFEFADIAGWKSGQIYRERL